MSFDLYIMLLFIISLIVFFVVTFLINFIFNDSESALMVGLLCWIVSFCVMFFISEDNIKPCSTQELQVVACSVTNNKISLETEDGENKTYYINQITFDQTDNNKTYLIIENYTSRYSEITIKASKENIDKIKGTREINLSEE